MKRSKQWDVRGAVSFAAFFYFLYSCAIGCLLPFLTLYFRHLGLTAVMTGIILAVKHAVALIWRPLSCILARRHNKRRMVITASLVCSAAVALALLLFPSTGKSTESISCNVTQLNAVHELSSTTLEPKTTLQKFSGPAVYSTEQKMRPNQEHNNTEHVPAMPVNISALHSNQSTTVTTSSQGKKKGSLGTKSVQIPSPGKRRRSLTKHEQKQQEMEEVQYDFLGSLKVMDTQHQMFFLVMIIIILWEILAAPLMWTADDGLHEYLDFVDATERHRAVKPWRLLGIAGGMGCSGILVSIFYCLTGTVLHFYTYTLLMVLIVPLVAFLPLYRHKRQHVPGACLKALYLVRGDPQAVLCVITAVLTGMAGSAVSDFLLWQMQDHNATELQMGITLAVVPLCQAAFAPLNGCLTRLLKFHGRLLPLGIMGLSLQCLSYSFMWTPWIILPAQVLAGISIGALWWSLEAQSVDIASPGTELAVKRVFEALYVDLGAGLGSVASGFVVQKFGIKVLFQGAAGLLGVWCITLAILQWRIPRQRRINYSRLLAADASEMSESESEQDNDWLEKAMEDDKGKSNWKRMD
ncbi:major facilitator superfamily domain-containing protein 6-like [Neoarius graeffei]|uniref:major facilitator superfamily domain-containing protein 6-like n=1 Tax=Neoarius graeffei TaxID=443677 RepID=UPI00298C63D4|nr:major facilitator superfamily domain-containing protein 6-like [Neoarius graeffei]